MSTLTVNCPSCKKPLEWSTDNPHRPFCSERCKLIDLGAWANEEFQIEGTSVTGEDSIDLDSDESWNEPPLH